MATTQAFREYITQNQQAFYRLAYSYTKNSDAALDVVQDAIVKGIEKLHTLRNPAYMKTWFYRILVNEGLNYLRGKKVVSLDEYAESPSPLRRTGTSRRMWTFTMPSRGWNPNCAPWSSCAF